MELQVTGTNLEISEAVRRHIERKLGKLNRHLPNLIESRVEISEEKTRSPQERYLVRVTVVGAAGGAVFHGEDRGEDPFKAVDGVEEIMVRQLEHHKGKLYGRGRGASLSRSVAAEEPAVEPPTGQVVKTKRFPVKPMPLDEAVEQMELLGHSFFLFFDSDSRRVKLLYLRKDGNYGLIDPEIG